MVSKVFWRVKILVFIFPQKEIISGNSQGNTILVTWH